MALDDEWSSPHRGIYEEPQDNCSSNCGLLASSMRPLEKCLLYDTAAACYAISCAYLVGAPLLLIFGTVGNVWTATVARRRGSSLRRSTTGALMFALAVADTIALWTGLGRLLALYATGTDVRHISPLTCKAQRFLLYFGMDASSSMLTAICVDRFVAVWLPHKKSHSVARTCWTIAALLVSSAAFNLHVFWTRGEAVVYFPRTNTTFVESCGYPKTQYKHYWENYHGWLMLAYYIGVPFIVMAVLNSLVAYKLRAQRMLLPGRGRSRDDFRLTVMLLTASLFFLIFTAPAAIFNTVETSLDRATQRRLKVVDAYTTMMQYANHAVHFYVYVLAGRGFRRDVRASLSFAA